MRNVLISLFFIMSVFSQNAIGAEKAAAFDIMFEVDSIFVEKRPKDVNDLILIFEESTDYDVNNVAAIENLNAWNVFKKPDVDVGYRIYFDFFAETEGKWQFEFVYDAGIASCAFVDQDVILFSDLDLWLNLDKPIVKKVMLKKGWHAFEFLALENCCGAPMRFRFKGPNADEFKVISRETLKLRSVPQQVNSNTSSADK